MHWASFFVNGKAGSLPETLEAEKDVAVTEGGGQGTEIWRTQGLEERDSVHRTTREVNGGLTPSISSHGCRLSPSFLMELTEVRVSGEKGEGRRREWRGGY